MKLALGLDVQTNAKGGWVRLTIPARCCCKGTAGRDSELRCRVLLQVLLQGPAETRGCAGCCCTVMLQGAATRCDSELRKVPLQAAAAAN